MKNKKININIIEFKEICKIILSNQDNQFDLINFNKNIELLLKFSDDDYLNQRAALIEEHLKEDTELYEYLGKLDLTISNNKELLKKYFNSFCIEERSDEKKGGYNFIDLFCGAGGLSLGFTQEGFKVNLACDIDNSCIETYRFNHIDVHSKYIINDDINNICNKINDLLKYKNVDIVIGGPPCQGFSIANQQRIIDDPRNELYKSYVKVVEKTKPKFFIMENVKGMLKVAEQVKEDFKRIGYNVEYKVFNAKDFGVPQNRERLIYIGTYTNISLMKIFEDIEKQKSKNITTLYDAISDLKELKASTIKNNSNSITEENGGIVIENTNFIESEYLKLINKREKKSKIIFNHQARYNNDRDIEIFRRLNQGDKSDDPKIADIMPYKNRNHIFKDKYYKLIYNSICKTITAHMKFDCNMYIHPTQARGLTPREAARIQSYPDDYVFKGAYTKTYMQIGNAVPPLLGNVIAKSILKALKEAN